jgi:phytoene dehydrogenase-like protein
MNKNKVVVIGAGVGGLFSGALFAKDNFDVQLLESHYASGGCAGFFKRAEGYYDVGATTISGLKKGRPLWLLLNKLGLELPVKKLEVAIEIFIKNKKITYYSDPKKLNEEFIEKFNLDLEKFIQKSMRIENDLWSALNIFTSFPKIKLGEIITFLKRF